MIKTPKLPELEKLGYKDTHRDRAILLQELRKQLETRKEALRISLERKLIVKKGIKDNKDYYKIELKLPNGIIASAEYAIEEDTMFFWNFNVGDPFRNDHILQKLGIGSIILEKAIEIAQRKRLRAIELECTDDKTKMYKKFGFEIKKRIFDTPTMTYWNIMILRL